MKKQDIKELVKRYEGLMKLYKRDLEDISKKFRNSEVSCDKYFSVVDSSTSSIVAYEHVIADLKELIK